jgi:uncharacterized protein YmfQ (DUF2313 family)
MSIKVSEFDIKTQDQNAQSLADLMPPGEFWRAFNITDSTSRKLLLGLATEIIRAQAYIESVANNYVPNRTTSFIDDWEKLVGIPDDCFTKEGIENGNQVDDAGRRRDIIVKLAKMNLQTEQDWIDLAAFFGFEITINNSTGGFNNFKWEIIFSGVDETGWDYTWDFPWGNSFVTLLECVFEEQRPAHTLLVFNFV